MANNMSYQGAKKVRAQSLTDLILDRQAGGQSVTGSIGSAISSKLKARATGVKEKFDPLNIVKFMTGGSKLATGIAGKMMGRSQSDIDYFTGRKSSTMTRVDEMKQTPQENISETTEVLSNIYNLMKNTRQEKRKEVETMKNFEESKLFEEERQHNEIINVFNKALGKDKRKAKDLSSMKMKFDKVFKKKKKIEIPKEKKIDEDGILKDLSKKLGLLGLIGGAAVLGAGALAKTKKEEPQEEPMKPTGTATKVPQERVSKIENESVRERIRAREGGGVMPYGMINIVQGDKGSSKVRTGNVDITTGKPYSKNLEDMTLSEVYDLQTRRSKYFGKSGMGSAAGAYGFMPGTLLDLAKKRYGDNWSKVTFTKDIQDLLADDLIGIIKSNIKKAGLPVSEAMIYTMWFFGAYAPNLAYKLVYDAPGNLKVEDVVSASAINANPHLKGKTIDWYRNNVLSNQRKGSLSTIPLQGTFPVEKQNETDDMKKEMSGKKSSSYLINQNNQSVIQNNYNAPPAVSEPHPILG